MKQLAPKSWIRTLLITCLASTTPNSYAKASEQFSYSLEYYLSGRVSLANLN